MFFVPSELVSWKDVASSGFGTYDGFPPWLLLKFRRALESLREQERARGSQREPESKPEIFLVLSQGQIHDYDGKFPEALVA